MNQQVQNKAQEQEFFDEWANSPTYVEYGHFNPYGHHSIIKEFHQLIGNRLGKGCKAIDLGCGAGAFTRRLFEEAEAECMGLDISEGLIQAAKKKDGHVDYVMGDIENLEFEDETFDVVSFSGVLHHFPEKQKCLKEGFRVLKKGGCLVAFDPNIKNPFMWFYKDFSHALLSESGQTENEKLFTDKEIISEIELAGFSSVMVKSIGGVTFKYVGSKVGQVILPIYNGIEFLYGKSPLAHKYGSFLISYGIKQ